MSADSSFAGERALAAPILTAPRVKTPILRWAFVFLLISTTLLERFGVNFTTYSLNAAWIGMYAFLGAAVLSGALLLSPSRLMLYGGCVGVAIVSALANERRTSFASLMLIGVMYFPYAFVLRPGNSINSDPAWVPRVFLDVALFAAFAGIVQFFAQYAIHADWLFDFTRYVPVFLRGPTGFNTVIAVGARHKSNGFFFREPSGFSFVMALALLVEAVSFRRLLRFASYGLALLLTYSGTGILALFLGSLFPLGRKTLLRLIVLLVLGGVAIAVFGDALNLSYTLGRATEFSSERSSGYIRYIAPLRLIRDTIGTEPWTAWIGHGPGTISREAQGYDFHDPTWAKLLFEYGSAGFGMFMALLVTTVRRPAVPAQIRAALFFGWLLMGGHLLSPEANFLLLALVGLMPQLSHGSRELIPPARATAPSP